MKFDLTSPCGNCPFRTDLASGPYIRADRVREVLGDPQARGAAYWPAGSFVCHKTVDYRRKGRARITARTQHCAGAAIVLMRDGVGNQAMQLAERLLGWNPLLLDLGAPVYASRQAAIAAAERAEQ